MTEDQVTPPVPVLPVVLIGLGAGLLAGMFGVGGGILIVPMLVVVLKFDQRFANGTSLAALVPIAVSNIFTYWAHGHIDWHLAGFIVVGALVGAVIGTHLLQIINRRALALIFSSVMMFAAVRLFWDITTSGRENLDPVHAVGGVLLGLFAGTMSGLLGIGGGVIMVPVLIMAFGIPPVIAKGTAVAVTIPTAAMGTWRNRTKKNVDMRSAAVLGAGGVVTAVIGGLIANSMPDRLSNVLFAILLLTLATRLLLETRKSH
jgi:uncharacterized membrane protein YfcA